MMKLVKILGTLLAAVTLGGAMVVMGPTEPAQAKAAKSLATVPQKFQCTWYYYVKYGKKGHYNRFTISANKTAYRNYTKKNKVTTGSSVLKSRSLKKAYKGNDGSTCMFMSKGYLVDIGWTYYSPKDSAYGTFGTESYKIVPKYYHGQKVQSLYSKNVWLADTGGFHLLHYYKTKAQAKYFNPTGANEDYPD